MSDELIVTKTYLVEEPEPNPDGSLDYRYAYWLYGFELSGQKLLRAAVRYLLDHERVSKVDVLWHGGYVALDLDRFR